MPDGVHLLPQFRKVLIHAQARAALVAQRTVLRDRMPRIIGEHAFERALLRLADYDLNAIEGKALLLAVLAAAH